ncbi:uncharacterized protein LOC130813064 [Amaranthus tricolor]|uniref:uncharacterized protein LOC130813064 n=1 Tax=Amaranthus tricolor TaxID=29722 RepID=UPI002589C3CE|nr:uncharacterized protein LOC130813064 [Amaranthus tricolor]XP_057534755.1 uncharacterized protein LOC130813064 [Amaranthus tricolor]XP_057534756.1 uncharacterized protein LOC130813064 [Amaranthus tricolor]
MVLDVDLNVPLPDINNEVGSSLATAATQVQVNQRDSAAEMVPIDVDAFDDDVVVLSSPRAISEVRNISRRNRNRSNFVDVESETTRRVVTNTRSKRRRVPTSQPIIISDNGVNEIGVGSAPPPPLPPPPPPPEPTFSCPICMGPLVEEMTTKCGHIFCKACIKKSISAQGKCPTCRKKVTMKDTLRIYLPATTQS